MTDEEIKKYTFYSIHVHGNGANINFIVEGGEDFELLDSVVTKVKNTFIEKASEDISDIEIVKMLKTKFVDEKKYDLAARMRDCEKILSGKPKTVADIEAMFEAPPAGEEFKLDTTSPTQ